MRRRTFLLAVAAATTMGCPSTQPPVVLPPPAKKRDPGLLPGDDLEIRVADKEELSGAFTVAEDGTLDFPWIGAFDVRGMTEAKLANELEARLSDGYLREPQVVVRITARQNREVSVLGQVNEPGSYPYKDRLTLVQAISLAGGLTPLALRRKVKLIRETERGKETFEIDLGRILDGKQDDLSLEPGDIVFVPESPV